MSISQNSKILKDDFNALFTRIEAVRTRHVSAGASIPNTYQSSSVTAGAQVKTTDVSTLNSALTNLSNSPWIDSSFTSGITIPSVGDLIQASSITTIEQKITTVEGLATGFTSAASKGNYTSAAREKDFSNFTSGTRANSSFFTNSDKSEGCFNANAKCSAFTK